MTHAIRLPPPFSVPMRLIPGAVHSTIISGTLNILLSSQRKGGELAFLNGKTLHVCIEDAGLTCSISMHNQRFTAGDSSHCDVKISATLHDFLLLISRTEDSDTLFFQRRLKMQGDTELGLYLKNFLDGVDTDSLPFYRLGRPLLVNGIHLLEGTGLSQRQGFSNP